jgi:beta-galactosidase/beta-glucuronidase
MIFYHFKIVYYYHMATLSTVYGETINRDHPLAEHPNPLFRRDHYQILNGVWDFALDQRKERPANFTKSILVPFSVETSLSGIGKEVKKSDYMHYRRKFHLSDEYLQGFVILHFDAVDQICDVFLNGDLIIHHAGGYTPFSYLIEHPQPENILEVTVSDDTDSPIYARGKQSNNSNGIWYTATSGIWQSVWLEAVPSAGYIKSIRIDPDFDARQIHITGDFTASPSDAYAEAYFHGRLVARGTFDGKLSATLDLGYDFYPWSPETPDLYEIRLFFGEDLVHSYCAMRKFSAESINGFRYFALNGHPYFISGVLDQGYFPDGGLTAPSEKAMIDDIKLAKKCGFNCLRKHIKIEPLRWYYLCDSLGMLVIQDFVNGGSRYSDFLMYVRPVLKFNISDTTHRFLGRASKGSRDQFAIDQKDIVDRLYNVPCIFEWTLFNEGWGQFDTVILTNKLKELDKTRLIDSSSGWYDKKCGDFDSHHVYFFKPNFKSDHKRILGLSECGGFSLGVERHKFSKKSFGYLRFHSFDSLNRAVDKLYRRQILHLVEKKGLCEVIFTQLTDVENETNGLITYDRKVQKIDIDMLRNLNHILSLAFETSLTKKK